MNAAQRAAFLLYGAGFRPTPVIQCKPSPSRLQRLTRPLKEAVLTNTASWAWYPGTKWPGFTPSNQDNIGGGQNGLTVNPDSYSEIIWSDPEGDGFINDADTDDAFTAPADRVEIDGVARTVHEMGEFTGSTIVMNGNTLTVELAVWVFTDGTYIVRLHDDGIPPGFWFDVTAITLGAFDGVEYDQSVVANRDAPFVCFAAPTAIATPDGPRLAGDLRVGDRVLTLDDGPQRVAWIGRRLVSGLGAMAPIRFAAGAMGNPRPLRLSASHRVLIRDPQAENLFGESEVLVPAAALVNGGTIRRAPCPVVRYVHFACARPQIVFAEGIPAETLNPGDYGLSCLGPRQRTQLLRALPDLLEQGGQPAARPCLSVFEGRLLSAALPAALCGVNAR